MQKASKSRKHFLAMKISQVHTICSALTEITLRKSDFDKIRLILKLVAKKDGNNKTFMNNILA